MADIIKLGSMYFGDTAFPAGSEYKNKGLSIRNTISGLELQWIKLKSSLLIADRCICVRINMNQLRKLGFRTGIPILVDGNPYLCRCLKCGDREGLPNEWDAALDEVGDDDNLWHWKGISFWGQEQYQKEPTFVIRGNYGPRIWQRTYGVQRDLITGFRPALDPLLPCLSEDLEGTKVSICCPGANIIEGTILSVDDYDLVLDTTSLLPANCSWATVDTNGTVIIEKLNVLWAKKEFI